MPAGYSIYKDKIDYKGLLPEIRLSQYNLDLLFNIAEIDGNIATWYDTTPPTITSVATTDNGCVTDRDVECVTSFARTLELDKRIDKLWKAFKCAYSKIDMSVMDRYAIKVERAINKLQLKEFLGVIATNVPNFVPTQTSYAGKIEELLSNIEAQGYDRSELIVVVNSFVASDLNLQGINCCEVNATGATIANKLNATIVPIKDSNFLPTGVEVLVYVKSYAVVGINCQRAEMYEAQEAMLRGWTIYDHFEEYGMEYFSDDTETFIGGKIIEVVTP